MPDLVRLFNAIERCAEHSYGGEADGELADQRAKNIDKYLGKNTLPVPEGRSNAQDRLVYETVQEIKPSLCRIFAGNDDEVVQLPPVGPEDEQGAKQESEYLNYQVLQKNNWFQVFSTATTDALLTKAGYLYPYAEKRRQVEVEKYERQTEESLALIMEDEPEVISWKEYPDPEYKPQPVMMQTQQGPLPQLDHMGQVVFQPPPMLYDVEIRRAKQEVSFCIEALPPERCKVSDSCKTVQVSTSCNYFEYYDYPTISELRADGYDIPDDVAYADDEGETLEDAARDEFGFQRDTDENAGDPSMRRVKCRWVWIRHDYDEDGIAELQYCVVVGKQVIHREEVNRIPIAVLCPDPLPHRHVGLCPADVVSELQDIKTAILRQGLDNLYLANNPRWFANQRQINLDDLTISRPGGVVRGKEGAIFGQHIAPIVTPNVFPQAMEALMFMDSQKQTRTGVNNNFQGLEANQLSQLQPGTINQISSMAAQRVEQIARNFANGIEELFAILHELILKSGHKKDVVKLRGQWVTVDPTTWRHRKDFRISVAYAAGNKDAQMARLMGIANLQKEALMGGLPIVTPANVYNTAVEITKASDMSTPQKFWTDPKDIPPPPPPQPDPSVVAMEQIKTQSAEKIKAAELQANEKVTGEKNQLEKYKADLQANVQLTIEQMKQQQAAQLEQFRASHDVNMKDKDKEVAAIKADESGGAKKAVSLEKDVKNLQQTLQQSIDDANNAIRGLITSGRRVNRGKDGRPESADILDAQGNVIAQRVLRRGKDNRTSHVDIVAPDGSVISSQKVVRDKSGRATGLE